jgi:hypothetical protein
MKLIDRQPLHEGSSEVWTPDGVALVKPFQIIVMVSLSLGDVLEPGGRRFPAILDTGLIQETFPKRRCRGTAGSSEVLHEASAGYRDSPGPRGISAMRAEHGRGEPCPVHRKEDHRCRLRSPWKKPRPT